jgi:hypothetical protein
MVISIAVCDPSESRVGGFQWSIYPDRAEKAFREFRGEGTRASLWHGVTVPEGMDGEEITDWVDWYYWEAINERESVWGKPVKVYDRLDG